MTAQGFTAAEQDALARIEAAPEAPEALRERVARAILHAVLGTDDGDLVADDFEIHASEIARLIVEHAADAALTVIRPSLAGPDLGGVR